MFKNIRMFLNITSGCSDIKDPGVLMYNIWMF